MIALSPTAIRPADAHDAFRALLESHRAAIVEPGGGLRPDISIDVDCPVCGASERRVYWNDRGLRFCRCAACALVYQSPRLTPEALDVFYCDSPVINHFHAHILAPTARTRKRSIHAPRLDELIRRIGRPGRLLDVGCATGQFLELARATGWTVRGVEPNALAAEICRKQLSLEVAPTICEAVCPGEEPFDVATLWEVLSHVFNPIDVLRRCGEVLRPGGLLMLTTPNIDGFEYRMLGERHENANGVLFLNLFSPPSLVAALERSGYEGIEISTPGRMDVENVAQAIRTGRTRPPSEPFWRDLLLAQDDAYARARADFQFLLARNELSGHMLAVARKP